MATADAGVLGHDRARRTGAPRLTVALVTIVSGAVYAWMRLASAQQFSQTRSFAGYCQRVKPPDVYPCHVDTAWQGRAYLLATLLIWAGMTAAGLFLATSGRGWVSIGPAVALGLGSLGAAFFGFANPMQVVPWLGVDADFVLGSPIGSGRWAGHPATAASLDLLLMVLPAVVVVLFVRPPRRRERWADRRAFDLAVLGCGAVATAVVVVPNGQEAWISLGFSNVPIFLPAVAMFAFGLLLPTRSRWWPWTIAPVAILLSQGPSGLLISSVLGMPTTLWFGSVLRLSAVGLLGSCAFPLAAWLERRSAARGPEDAVTPDHDAGVATRWRGRVPLTAVAVGLLLVSGIAAATDALPVQISVSLPTYLGLRERAQDVRAQENLAIALDAFDRFRTASDPARFDADAGASLAPSIAWSDDPMAGGSDDLVVSVLRTSSAAVRLTTVSGSGAAFCVEAARARRWSPTIGVGAAHGSNGRSRALEEAIAGCGSSPFVPTALPDLSGVAATLCDESPPDHLVLCRSVQHLVAQTLANARPVTD